MDIFEVIKVDHEHLRELVEKMLQTTVRAGKARARMVSQLRADISLHQDAEEKVFYSFVLDEKELREDALEAIEEHHVLNHIVRELDRTSPEDETWRPKLIVLGEVLEHHLEEEEDELFDEVQELLDEEEAQDLARDFQAEKEEARVAASKQRAAADDEEEEYEQEEEEEEAEELDEDLDDDEELEEEEADDEEAEETEDER